MRIIHADHDLAVCVKPVGLDAEKALPDALKSELGGEIYTVHRLDLNVGGVMIYARTKYAAAALSRSIQEGAMVKEYVARVHGAVSDEGDWSDLLLKDVRKNKVFVVDRMRKGVKDARLTFTRLETDGNTSLVRIRLHTGRSHQIRVQFASRRHPLVGDHKYGARDEATAPMLFSCCITFPWKGGTMRFEQMPDWAMLSAERLERIAAMETTYDRAAAALAAGQLDAPEFPLLAAYLDDGDWRVDYEADEQGRVPSNMKRGVLSQDGLYNLVCDWEAARRVRCPIIHVFGASGSGTTTLGRALAEKLGYRYMDTDDYYWLPTDPPFVHKRPIPERLEMMNAEIDGSVGAVISGAMTGWGDPLIPRFTLAVRVVTATDVRISRLVAREYARFGARIREGGDMYDAHQKFLAWAAQYDTGDVTMRSKACHDIWQETLPCQVIVVDGDAPLEVNLAKVIAALDNAE